jgi:glycosyltransferase involved in cell wall biosynthesis
MPRVLFISPQPFFQWRGSPIRVSFDVQALSENGCEVDLLTLPIGEEKQIARVRVIRVSNPFGVKNISIGPSLLKAAFDVLLFIKAVRLNRQGKYDVIHGIEEAGFLAVVLAKMFNTRAVFEKHSDPFSYRSGFIKNVILTIYSKVESFTVKRANLVIGTGQGLAEQARVMGATCPVYNIFDIPSSLVEPDAEKAAAIAKQLKQTPDEVLITFVGSFAVYQGVDIMFSMIPHVVKENPNARFVIIGGSDSEIEDRKQQLREAGVENSVSFLKKIPPDDVPNHLAASDILIAPRIAGVNTPLKILDYFKAGGAIVATDIPSNRLILDDTTAVFARPDPNSFGDAILHLLEQPEVQKRLGETGRYKYENEFNFGEFKKLLAKAYEELSL